MQKTWREALLFFLALLVGGLLLSAVSFALVRTSYAGVSDESAVQAGVAAFPDYLATVARAIALLGAGEVFALFAVTSGLVVLAAWVREAPADKGGRVRDAEPSAPPRFALPGARPALLTRRDAVAFSRWLLVGLAVHLLFWGCEARRHPGLFLPLLSASSIAPLCVAAAEFAWPLVVAASALGWARFAIAASRSSHALLGAAGAMAAVAWLAMFELSVPAPPSGVSALAASRRAPALPAGPSSSSPPDAPRIEHRYPNILLLGVDSLRPDKISAETTPVLARLCRESVYFPNTLVTLPRTAPSWAALLTSLPPLANGIETMFPTQGRADLATLAMPAHLASLGYTTAVVSEYAGESFARMKLGFQKEAVPRVELEQILGQGLLARQPMSLGFAAKIYTAPRWLSRLLPNPVPELMRGFASFAHPRVLGADLEAALSGGAHPWFALAFYSQPHFPYTASRPFDGRYAVAGADAALRFGKDVTHGEVRTDADRAQIDALYRAALAETDAAVADLLARVSSDDGLDDTIIVLTADHGEGLYECPTCVGHGDNLTGMMSLRVPLAIRLPRRRFPVAQPVTVDTYVSQLDVYPTLLALLGVARPRVQEGAALLSAEGVPVALPAERVFFAESGEWLWPTPAVPAARLDYPPITTLARVEDGRIVIADAFLPAIRAAKHRAAILPPYKLVYAPTPSRVEWRLYDFEHDPREEEDLSTRHPEITERLRAALRHSVLRFSHMLPAGDYFLTRPASPPEEYY